MKKISLLSLLVLLLFSTFVKAELIHISPNYYEDGIFYDVDWDSHEVSVTYRGISPTEYMDEYRGTVIIPESVFYDDSVYHVVGITSQAFQSCYNLAAVNIPSTVLYIGEEAFAQSGITSLVIPGSVQEIEEGAFYNMQDLLTVRFEEGVPYIPQSAFAISESLRIVYIPASVTEIRRQAFYTCTGLDTVYFASSFPPTIAYDSFDAEECVFQVPCGSKNAYVAALNVDASRVVEYCAPAPCTPVSGTCGAQGDNLTWELSCDSVLTISGTGDMADREYNSGLWYDYRESIKSIIVNNGVTSIGKYAFRECINVTSIIIPNSVTSIKSCAFYDCSSLTDIILPDGITQISWHCFYGCSSLTSINIPDGVTIIYDSAFRGCTSLESVIIPNSVTVLQQLAFYECRGLKSVTIGNQVPKIPTSAFYGCSSLEAINIPSSVTEITEDSFGGCSGLISISVEAGNSVYDSRNDCNAIIETSSNKLVVGCQNTVIPSNVISIVSCAFSGCSGMTTMTIPNSVTSIGDGAFYGCTGLISITCGAVNPPTLGSNVFKNVNCSQIPLYVPAESIAAYQAADVWNEFTNIQPIKCLLASGTCGAQGDNLTWELSCDSVLTISGTGAMEDYTSYSVPWYSKRDIIHSIVIDNGVTSIGNSAFEGCGNLRSIDIPNSVVAIGERAFYFCLSMIATMPNSVISVGNEAFHLVPNIYYEGELGGAPWDARCLNGYVDGVFVYENSSKTNLKACLSFAIGEITIPNSVVNIGYYAFAYCSGVTKINIPNSVITIEEGAFGACENLTSLEIPNSVTNIGNDAFAFCSGLSNIVLGSGITNMGFAFMGCESLESIVNYAITPLPIDQYMFYYVDKSACTLYVLAESIEAYQAADQWKEFTNIQPICPIASGTCGAQGDNLTWELSCDSILTISGTGDMAHYVSDTIHAPWYDNNEYIVSVIIENGVTSIGRRAFYNCDRMTSVAIPNSMVNIWEQAFYNCDGLTDITIPSSVTNITSSSFDYCSGITSIHVDEGNTVYDSRDNCNAIIRTASNMLIVGCENTIIPNSVTIIGASVFSDRKGLTSAIIPNNVISIGSSAYIDCINLTDVTIGNNVTGIGDGAFYQCSSLSNVTIPNSVTVMGGSVFYKCANLTNVVISNSIARLGSYFFYQCSNLTTVLIPASVTNIGTNAFSGCYGLTDITCKALTPPTLESDVFAQVDKSIPLYVPCGSVTAYQTAEGWSEFTNVQPIIPASGACGAQGDNLTWELSCDSVLTISGTGEMAEYSYGNNGISSPWTSYASQIKSIILEEGVTSIGTYAFYNYGDARYNSVKSITIPNSLVRTGFNVFSGITSMEAVYITDLAAWMNIVHSNTYGNPLGVAHHLYVNGVELENLVVPDGTTAIKPSVFIGCKGLKSMQLPGSVQTIGSNAFANCSGLKDVTLPEGLQVVDNSAFYQCDSLETIHVSSTVTRLGNCSFEGCPQLKGVYIVDFAAWCNMTLEYSSPLKQAHHLYLNDVELTEVDIPETCTIIKDYVFEGCSELTAVYMHDNITSINHFAFNGCTSLQSIVIPENVTYIGSSAFVGCSGLQQVEFLSTTPPAFFNNWGARIFMGNDATYLVPCGSRDAYVAALNTGDASPYQIDASRIIERMPFTYSVVSVDETKGAVSVITEPACADMTLSFRADAEEGYLFTQWSDGNTENPRTLILTQDTALVAEFEANPCFVPVTTSVSAEACDSYYWAEADTTIAGSSVYTHTFATVAGCDSIVTLNLTIHESAYASDTMFIVQGDTILFDINAGMDSLFDQASNNYVDRDTMPTIFGCDSIILHFMYEITVDTVVVSEGETPDLSDLGVSEESDVTVEPGGAVTVDEDDITIHSLAIVVSGWSSGQVNNPDKRVFHVDDIYIDFRLDPNSETASEDRWYAFSVPFKVNINGGIKNKNSNAPVYGTDYIILEYDGNARANTGRGWHTLNGNMLKPGKFYMFGINGTNCNNWEFHMEVGEEIFAPDTVDVEAYQSSNTQDGGWNGIGNPTLSYSTPYMSDIPYLCLYDNHIGDYILVRIDDVTLAVGQPFFIQTGASGTFDFNFNYEVSASVRRREAQRRNPLMKLSLIRSGETITTGRMYVSLHDDATGRYTVGRDFARMTGNAGLAHIWSEAYGIQLAAHGVQEPENETIVPLGISAPANGEYFLEAGLQAMDEYDVELLCQGAPFATLFADQPLTLNLKAGTTHDYSLRIRRKSPTDLDKVQTDDIQCTKMLIDHKLYIFQGGRIYDAQGQLVK